MATTTTEASNIIGESLKRKAAELVDYVKLCPLIPISDAFTEGNIKVIMAYMLAKMELSVNSRWN